MNLKWRVQLPACNFNEKWTPSGIFQRFCLVFKLFCLNGLLYWNFSRISRICIFRNTFPRLLLVQINPIFQYSVQTNLIFQHSPFSNSRSSSTFLPCITFYILSLKMWMRFILTDKPFLPVLRLYSMLFY